MPSAPISTHRRGSPSTGSRDVGIVDSVGEDPGPGPRSGPRFTPSWWPARALVRTPPDVRVQAVAPSPTRDTSGSRGRTPVRTNGSWRATRRHGARCTIAPPGPPSRTPVSRRGARRVSPGTRPWGGRVRFPSSSNSGALQLWCHGAPRSVAAVRRRARLRDRKDPAMAQSEILRRYLHSDPPPRIACFQV